MSLIGALGILRDASKALLSLLANRTIAGELRGAAERGELELFHQPQVELVSGKIARKGAGRPATAA